MGISGPTKKTCPTKIYFKKSLPVVVAVVAVVAGVVDRAPLWSGSRHPAVAGPPRVVAAEPAPVVAAGCSRPESGSDRCAALRSSVNHLKTTIVYISISPIHRRIGAISRQIRIGTKRSQDTVGS